MELPFRFSFGHALAERNSSTNVLVRLALADGSVGWGRGCRGSTSPARRSKAPRPRSPTGSRRRCSAPTVDDRGAVPDIFQAAVDVSDAELDLAARCALELAFLDACGKHFRTSVQRWLGAAPAAEVRYDAVIPFSSPRKLVALALVIRAFGIRQVKIKVGDDLERDLHSLELLRKVLGQDVDLRVDANCAWTPAEAVEAIERMGAHRIAAVEQPVAGEDVDGLRSVSDAVSVPVIADESLRTVEEARAARRDEGVRRVQHPRLEVRRAARLDADRADRGRGRDLLRRRRAGGGERDPLRCRPARRRRDRAALPRGLRRQPAAEARPDRGACAARPARASARLRRALAWAYASARSSSRRWAPSRGCVEVSGVGVT